MDATELNGDGRPANLPGVYRHPETGIELIARRHRKFGDAQADGFVQVGYKYVGPEPKVTPKAKEEVKPEVKAEVKTAVKAEVKSEVKQVQPPEATVTLKEVKK